MPNLKKGDRIRLLAMPHDPDPIPVGSIGTVADIRSGLRPDEIQVWVTWDSGRNLALCVPPDHYEIIEATAP